MNSDRPERARNKGSAGPKRRVRQVVDSVLRNQGVQASMFPDTEGVVSECGTRVLKTVNLPLPLTDSYKVDTLRSWYRFVNFREENAQVL